MASYTSSDSAPVIPEWVGLGCAFASPLVYSAVNVLDKHVLDDRVQSVRGYVILVGVIAASFSLAMSFLASWESVSISSYLWSLLSGFVFGLAGFLYYFALEDESASSVVGLEFAYPLVICALAVVFLHEKIGTLSLIGIGLTVGGAILLSADLGLSRNCFRCCGQRKAAEDVEKTPLAKPINQSPASSPSEPQKQGKMATWKFALIVGLLVCCTATYEFSYKLASGISPFDIATLCYLMLAVTFPGGMAAATLVKEGRAGLRTLLFVDFHDEASRNTGWAVLNESLTLISILCTIFAMAALPASLVAPLGAVQPLYVLLIESAVSCFSPDSRMAAIKALLRKLIPMIVLTAGIVLLSLDNLG